MNETSNGMGRPVKPPSERKPAEYTASLRFLLTPEMKARLLRKKPSAGDYIRKAIEAAEAAEGMETR